MTAETLRGCYTVAEYPHETMRLACKFCPRKGQYRQYTLLARYGPDIGLPDLRLKSLGATTITAHRGSVACITPTLSESLRGRYHEGTPLPGRARTGTCLRDRAIKNFSYVARHAEHLGSSSY